MSEKYWCMVREGPATGAIELVHKWLNYFFSALAGSHSLGQLAARTAPDRAPASVGVSVSGCPSHFSHSCSPSPSNL